MKFNAIEVPIRITKLLSGYCFVFIGMVQSRCALTSDLPAAWCPFEKLIPALVWAAELFSLDRTRAFPENQ
jgi:hypothetical protein